MEIKLNSIEIYKLKPSNSSNFNEYKDEKRKLLWHVTQAKNYHSLIEHGLTVSYFLSYYYLELNIFVINF